MAIMEGRAQQFFAYGISFLSFLSLVYAVVGLCFSGAYVSEQAAESSALMNDELAVDTAADEMNGSLTAALSVLSLGVFANGVQCVALMTRAFGPGRLAKVSLQRKTAVLACGAATLLLYPALFYLDFGGQIELDADHKLTTAAAMFLMACCVSAGTVAGGFALETSADTTREQAHVPPPNRPTLLQQGRTAAANSLAREDKKGI
jgi:hypothetical protein